MQTVQFLRSCWNVNNLQPSHFEQLYLKMQLQKLVTYIYYMQLTRFNHSRLYFCLVGGRKKDNPMQLSLDIFKQSSVLHQRSSVILDDMGLLIYFQIPIKCIKMWNLFQNMPRLVQRKLTLNTYFKTFIYFRSDN